ncbi:MAG: ribosomal protein S18-alanine N-acetyltransferase [Thermoanaerobacteraceae bacterium]|nr:ribosomal protein S18-alanine N-acetyltransferase [Thermoanaerobacteraceae bacterium]
MVLSSKNDLFTLSFEPMQLKHLPQVLDIERQSFPTPWSKKTFLGELRHNQFAYYYVCLLEEQVVGYGGLWVVLDEAHVTTIAVSPQYRRRKIGARLLLFLMQQALMHGADKITLEVRPSNLSAKRLYENMGFTEAGVRKGYYTDNNEDAIIMWKQLLPNRKDETDG